MVSPWVIQTLREFGLSMGLSRLHFNDQDVACITIENIGTLYIEIREPGVVIYLARQDQWSTDRMECALALTHPGEALPYNAFCGMRGEHLVFGTCLAEEQFTLAEVEQVVEKLSLLHDRTMQALA